MKILNTFLAVATLVVLSKNTQAANGDTLHVVSHQNVVMTTDPGGSGTNENKQWAVFPAAGTSYRKAFVEMKYKCPDGMTCGEWDYIDQILLRRVGGVNGADRNLELVRFITPYGLTFNAATWSFKWHVDVTDFAMYLHDSVEISYVHTGYESSSGRGWDVTLDFNMVEGPWVMEPVNVVDLWNGSWGFGNPANPIENYLTAMPETLSAQTEVARVRIHHTGHGFDNNDGCSEFCDRYRDLLWDGAFVKRQQLWRMCGFNELFPQGGTWVYNRGNWCPGAVVYPFSHDFSVTPGSTHSVDIDMEPYVDAAPSGNEVIRSYMIEYKKPTLQNDVRVDEIFRPSNMPEYNRINPVCDEPMIQVTNLGLNDVTSMTINYGFSGQSTQTFYWSGNLASGQTDTISLTGQTVATQTDHLFTVNISQVNGLVDSYTQDNTAASRANAPTVTTETQIYLELKTNNEPEENGYELTDTWGNVVYSRAMGTLAANTIYKDTFNLPANTCYRFILHDIDPYGGDGLNFWANSAGGSGYARLRKVTSIGFIKVFPTDFGSRIEFNFTVGNVVSGVNEVPSDFNVSVYPNPSNGMFVLDCLSPEASDWRVEVFDALGKRVSDVGMPYGYGGMENIDLSHQPVGMYTLRVTHGGENVTRRLMLVR